MTIEPRLDIIGAALADPSRARILCELMDGRAFTNKELSCAAGTTVQTATAHLKRLEGAGLTASLRSGRHVYHRIAGSEVAAVLERLAHLSPTDHLYQRGQNGEATRLARSCYSHLAGRLGVVLTERMVAMEALTVARDQAEPGPAFQMMLSALDMARPFAPLGKPLVSLCLDWTERHYHISGQFASAFLAHCLDRAWFARRTGCRSLAITPEGFGMLARVFSLTADLTEDLTKSDLA